LALESCRRVIMWLLGNHSSFTGGSSWSAIYAENNVMK
jgi:hypothetical protein